jgi:PAS domain S-box-containing protein
MSEDSAIYSSRITKIYLTYLENYYPHTNTDALLEYAGMSRYEVEDPGHWFTQQQVDRFHEILIQKTGNPNVSREAGRFSTSSRGLGAAKRYTMGFLSPVSAYLAAGKVVGKLSRGTVASAKQLAADKVEAIFTPKPGVVEKPYQCENRLGALESIAKFFTGKFAKIDHPACYHRGDGSCRYIITWDQTPSLLWRRARNYLIVLMLLALLALWPQVPLGVWEVFLWCGVLLSAGLSLYALHLEKRELINTIRSQGEAAREDLEQMNIRYNNALLVQEIGQATVTIVDTDALIRAVMQIVAKRLDFDRGVLMLANLDKTRLVYRNGFGYSPEQAAILRETEFHLDRPDAKGVFVRAFTEQKPFLLDDIHQSRRYLSDRSWQLVRQLAVQSIICVPIIYKEESLGILAVDNIKSERALTRSDMNLLTAVASQTAVGLVNARSYRQLQESEEKYRNILENIVDGYFEVDLSGNLSFLNEAACRILGYPKSELLGTNYRQHMEDETAAAIASTFRHVYETGGVARAREWKVFRKDGSECFIQLLVSLIRDSNGNPLGFRGIARDLTERILADQERKRLEARLQQAEKMEAIGTLAGGVAHDLNNVLSGLVSYPELLLMELPADSPLRKPILTIQKSGERASAIVQDLLTLARRGVAVSEVVQLNTLVADLLRSPEYELIKTNYPATRLETDLAADTLNILGSPVHLSKSLMNIITNAAEAMPEGGTICIKTENRYLDRPVKGYDQIKEGEYVVVTISDSGVGIADTDIDRIFEPFYTKKVMGRSGSGLGMAVVWGTVKDHKGYIDVASRPDMGSTFTLYFPVTRKPLAGSQTPSPLEKFMGSGECVVVVDDVAEQREIASQMLTKLGYEVHCVSSGEAAVAHLQQHGADLVVLDMIMEPGIDGLETYRRLLEIRPDQRAIIASGYSETELVRSAQRLGAGAYIRKPYTMETLAVAVAKELGKIIN